MAAILQTFLDEFIWNFLILYKIALKYAPYVRIGSENGLMLDRQNAINPMMNWCTYALHGLNELRQIVYVVSSYRLWTHDRHQYTSHIILFSRIKSMGWCKKNITQLLTHWSYIFLALSHRNIVSNLVNTALQNLAVYTFAIGQNVWF